MIVLQWIRFLLGTGFLLCGILVFGIELFGVFKFRYVLNRMHAAAMGDTFGIALSMIGLIILNGWNFTSFCGSHRRSRLMCWRVLRLQQMRSQRAVMRTKQQRFSAVSKFTGFGENGGII